MSKKPTKQELIDHVESLVAKCEELTRERDEAMVLIETIARDVSILSSRPANIIKFSDLVDHINEWGDAARKILDKKENTDE